MRARNTGALELERVLAMPADADADGEAEADGDAEAEAEAEAALSAVETTSADERGASGGVTPSTRFSSFEQDDMASARTIARAK